MKDRCAIKKQIIGNEEQLEWLEIMIYNDYIGEVISRPMPGRFYKCRWSMIVGFENRNEVRRFYRKYGIEGTTIGKKGLTNAYFKGLD